MARINFGDHYELVDANNIVLSKYLQVPVSDSMKFTFGFIYPGEFSNLKVDLNDVDIVFEFFCKDNNEKVFEASKKGQAYTNCVLYEDVSSIRVLIQDSGLEAGYLLCRVTIFYPDLEFDNGTAKIVRMIDPKIALVSDHVSECQRRIDASKEDRFNITVEVPYLGSGGGKKKFTALFGSINSIGFIPDDAEKFKEVFTDEVQITSDTLEITSKIFAGTYGNGIALPVGFEKEPKSAIKYGMFDCLSAYTHSTITVDDVEYDVYWDDQVTAVVADADEEIKWNF